MTLYSKRMNLMSVGSSQIESPTFSVPTPPLFFFSQTIFFCLPRYLNSVHFQFDPFIFDSVSKLCILHFFFPTDIAYIQSRGTHTLKKKGRKSHTTNSTSTYILHRKRQLFKQNIKRVLLWAQQPSTGGKNSRKV